MVLNQLLLLLDWLYVRWTNGGSLLDESVPELAFSILFFFLLVAFFLFLRLLSR